AVLSAGDRQGVEEPRAVREAGRCADEADAVRRQRLHRELAAVVGPRLGNRPGLPAGAAPARAELLPGDAAPAGRGLLLAPGGQGDGDSQAGPERPALARSAADLAAAPVAGEHRDAG